MAKLLFADVVPRIAENFRALCTGSFSLQFCTLHLLFTHISRVDTTHQYSTAINMWSFRCIVAELFLGLPLFPGQSEFDLLKRMIKKIGSVYQALSKEEYEAERDPIERIRKLILAHDIATEKELKLHADNFDGLFKILSFSFQGVRRNLVLPSKFLLCHVLLQLRAIFCDVSYELNVNGMQEACYRSNVYDCRWCQGQKDKKQLDKLPGPVMNIEDLSKALQEANLHTDVGNFIPLLLRSYDVGSFQRMINASKGMKVPIFLVYDGMLSPIVSVPERAFMYGQMRATVREVSLRFPTAIISNRRHQKMKIHEEPVPDEDDDLIKAKLNDAVKTPALLEGQRQYNSVIHSIQENVTEQLSILQGGELRPYQLEGCPTIQANKLVPAPDFI
ncbi:helicase [Tanacetum coccineum]